MARFEETYCSQCGKAFGPRDSGFSHCSDHQEPRPTIFVQCPCCGGEGRIYKSRYGGNDPDVWDAGQCEMCEGTGTAEVEAEPIELEDLEQIP